MPLQHPTIAERVKADGRPVSTAVRDYPHEVVRSWPSRIEYIFDDDSSIVTIGRGKGQTVTAELP